MQSMALEERLDGSIFSFDRGSRCKRSPEGDGRWFKHTENGWTEVSDRRARRLERAYRHSGQVKRVQRFPRSETDLEPGQLVQSVDFGLGKIVATSGANITVVFGEHERRVDAQDLITRPQAEAQWYAYWFSGAKRRFEEGKRLVIVKSLCRFGEWQAFLDRYNYPRSTADDLIRRYENEMKRQSQHLPGNRANELTERNRQDSESTSDSDAEERRDSVRLETEKRSGREPSDHSDFWNLRIKLPPRIRALCREKYKARGAKEFWRRAAYRFAGLDQASDGDKHYPKP